MDRYEKETRIEELREEDGHLCNIMSGMDWSLEMLADQILADGRRGVVKHSELRDYLSASQLDLRRSREVYPTSGSPERHLFSGLYGRAYNPLTRGERSSKATPNLEGDVLDHE